MHMSSIEPVSSVKLLKLINYCSVKQYRLTSTTREYNEISEIRMMGNKNLQKITNNRKKNKRKKGESF